MTHYGTQDLALNQELELFSEPCTLTWPNRSIAGNITISLNLEYSPSVEMCFASPQLDDEEDSWNEPTEVEIPSRHAKFQAKFTEFDMGDPPYMESHPRELEASLDPIPSMGRVRGYLLGFPETEGEKLGARIDGIVHTFQGRITFQDTKWRYTIDAYHDTARRKARSGLYRSYLPTHVYQIERIDGKLFNPPQILPCLERFFLTLDFVAGCRCCLPLVLGYRHLDSPTWWKWLDKRPDHGKLQLSWAGDQLRPEVFECMNGICALWQDDKNHAWLRMAVDFYIEACRSAAGRDLSLVTAQAGLELLSHVQLIKRQGILLESTAGKLTADEKIRAMLVSLDLPTAIPPEYADARSAFRRHDGPSAIGHVRNSLMHPEATHSGHKYDSQVRTEIAVLALEFFELCILRIIGYEGRVCLRSADDWRRARSEIPSTKKR